MRDVAVRHAAPVQGAALLLSLGLVVARPAAAQFPRIVPPPPCVVPTELQVRPNNRVSTDRRPLLVVESIDVSLTERGSLHLPWGVASRVRERVRRARGLTVATDGSVERALAESGGSPDSAAALLRADWILRGRSHSVPQASELAVELLKRGYPTPVWRGSFRLPAQPLVAVEGEIAKGIVHAILGSGAEVPSTAAGAPRSDEAVRLLLMGEYLLRTPSASAADSARGVLERAFAVDTASVQVAVRLGHALLEVVARSGANPPLRRADALRRADELAKYSLARDPRRADAWTVRAVTARLRDTLRFEGALEAHAKALALAPNDAAARQELALTYMALGDDARATAELRRALTAEAERASTLSALADIELRERRYNQACAFANAAVAAYQFDPEAYAVRAQARVRLGQARDAYADSETAQRLTDAPWTQGLRLLIEAGAGNTEGATRLGRALAPRFLATGRLLGVHDAVMLAKGYLAIGDTRRAREALSRATPRGRELVTALRDVAFDPLRGDSLFRALIAPAPRPPAR